MRELIISGFIELHFVPTDYNVADILTKALSPEQYELLRAILMHGHCGKVPDFEIGNVHFALTVVTLMSNDNNISVDEL